MGRYHQSQELDAQRALDRMDVVRACIDERRAVAAKFHTPGLAELWDDFQQGLGGALDEADKILQDIAARARDAQQQAHARIMLRQIVRDEYVPARTPVDVVAKLRAQLGRASEVEVSAAEGLPEVLLDWNLLWHGLSNALSNARKYGDRRHVVTGVQIRFIPHILCPNPTDPSVLTHRADQHEPCGYLCDLLP